MYKLYVFTSFLILLGVGCNTKKDGKTNSIKVGYLPIAECLPLYVAKEKGYFEKYGLEVELISASGGPIIFKELEAGSIDIGFSNVVSLLKQTNSGKNYISVFGATYETISNNNHAMYSLRVNNNYDLSTLKFGVNARNNIEELMLLNYLKNRGIEINEKVLTNIKEVPFTQMLTELRTGKTIDVACVVEPVITIAKNDSSTFSYIGNHYKTDSSHRIIVATYVAKGEFAKSNRNIIEKFILAMAEATEEITSSGNNQRNLVVKYSKIDQNLLEKISLPLFEKKANPNDLKNIMDLMYDSILNRNKNFIPHPAKRVDPVELLFN